ncbi:hypothetical protein ACMSEG_25715 [Bacteroides faecis]|uniref:hypothetical protein n=1 Tax=Bacteroides faecis TaxID=674529 RepID=UPI001C8C18DF|nr:hypothetical protein [Bacteroides faecis]
MKLIQFIISILLVVCAIGMLIGAVVNPSPMQVLSIIGVLIICILCFVMTRTTYKELVDKKN